MAKRHTNQNSLSKKELMKVIEKIDAGNNQMKNRSQKQKTNHENNNYFSSKQREIS